MLKPPSFWKNINIISALLYPISILYSCITKLRYFLQTPQQQNRKIICIGNVTLGGSGKTPIAIAIGKLLISKKYKIAYACKNYGASIKAPTRVESLHKPDQVIDEALLLSKTAPTFVAANRADAIHAACKNSDIVIVDDGFQNNSFKKDLSILAVPHEKNFGNNFIFPAGPLRESLKSGIAKADLIFLTTEKKNSTTIKKYFPEEKIFQTSKSYKLCGPKRKKYIAFCSIANPSSFFQTLKDKNIQTIQEHSYPDHHHYTKKDLEKLLTQAKKLNAGLITTEKDLVKLNKQQQKEISYLELTITLENKKLIDYIIKAS